MNNIYQVALIGGTGKAGKYLLKQLLSVGYKVKLLHRKPDKVTINHPLLKIVKGNARNYHNLSDLFTGCHAVLSCLGQPLGESSIFSDATLNILKAMEANAISRYICIAGLNVDTPFDRKGHAATFGTKWMYENYPVTTTDRQREYELLSASDTDWTMVRLPLIIQTDETSVINVDLTDCPGNEISATSLALFIIEQLKSRKFIKKAPFIANQ
ncbi:NAD(P)-dependent oxidoreductase [Mucilaginibacter litoreus]|uniref:NAD(P)-dependent oxidoreductase n=1 Tax=Mucilaginibacter litoreus TaxID=1048221 RepID=A0ABW3AUF0_9SPHI